MIICYVEKLAKLTIDFGAQLLKCVLFPLLFVENDMDGDALSLAFAAHSGPDCLKDVVPKYGLRLKLYQAIKVELEAERCQVMLHLCAHA